MRPSSAPTLRDLLETRPRRRFTFLLLGAVNCIEKIPGSKPRILSRRCPTGTRWRVGLQYRATSLVYSHQRAQRVPIWAAEPSPKTAILCPNVGARCCACAARARSAPRPRAARLMVTPRGPISDLSALILLKESSAQVLVPMDKRRAFSSSPFWRRCITVHQ